MQVWEVWESWAGWGSWEVCGFCGAGDTGEAGRTGAPRKAGGPGRAEVPGKFVDFVVLGILIGLGILGILEGLGVHRRLGVLAGLGPSVPQLPGWGARRGVRCDEHGLEPLDRAVRPLPACRRREAGAGGAWMPSLPLRGSERGVWAAAGPRSAHKGSFVPRAPPLLSQGFVRGSPVTQRRGDPAGQGGRAGRAQLCREPASLRAGDRDTERGHSAERDTVSASAFSAGLNQQKLLMEPQVRAPAEPGVDAISSCGDNLQRNVGTCKQGTADLSLKEMLWGQLSPGATGTAQLGTPCPCCAARVPPTEEGEQGVSWVRVTGGCRGTGTPPDPVTMSLGCSGALLCGLCPPHAWSCRAHPALCSLALISQTSILKIKFILFHFVLGFLAQPPRWYPVP